MSDEHNLPEGWSETDQKNMKDSPWGDNTSSDDEGDSSEVTPVSGIPPISGNTKLIMRIVGIVIALGIAFFGGMFVFGMFGGDGKSTVPTSNDVNIGGTTEISTPEPTIEPKEETTPTPTEEPADKSWKQLYIDFINNYQPPSDAYNKPGYSLDYPEYSLMYINDDDIPELYVYYGYSAGGDGVRNGGDLCTVFNGEVRYVATDRAGEIEYSERNNLILHSGGRMDNYYHCIYSIENGEFVELHRGEWNRIDGTEEYKFYWDNSKVSKKKYAKAIQSIFGGEWVLPKYEYSFSRNDLELSLVQPETMNYDEIVSYLGGNPEQTPPPNFSIPERITDLLSDPPPTFYDLFGNDIPEISDHDETGPYYKHSGYDLNFGYVSLEQGDPIEMYLETIKGDVGMLFIGQSKVSLAFLKDIFGNSLSVYFSEGEGEDFSYCTYEIDGYCILFYLQYDNTKYNSNTPPPDEECFAEKFNIRLSSTKKW